MTDGQTLSGSRALLWFYLVLSGYFLVQQTI
jgi:hypothetical protein